MRRGSKFSARQLDALKDEHLGELVEVRVAVEYSEATVLRGCRGDQRVGDGHAVVAVATLGQLAEGAHRGVGDGAIVAQDSQRVELGLQCEVLGGASRRI